MSAKRYCQMCDEWVGARAYTCPACGDKTVPVPRRKLTRTEQLEWLADRGVDTWADLREEK